MNDHLAALQEGFAAEAIGCALYGLLRDRTADSRERDVLTRLEAIEAATRDRIASLLSDAGATPTPGDAVQVAARIAAHVEGMSWSELHRWLLDGSIAGRGVYDRIRDTAPNPSDERITAVLGHVDEVNGIYAAQAG
jgi:hypothetical protein